MSNEKIIEMIKEMSVLELNDLVKAIEEEFGVTAAAPVAVAGAAGASNEQIDSIGKKLRDINDKYHGRGDILNYAVECTKNSQMPSYLEYMKEHYPEEKRSPLFKSILETGKPNEAYFQKVSEKMTPEELAENQK